MAQLSHKIEVLHLVNVEHGVIFAEHQRGSILLEIGRLLRKHHGTIGHELKRGGASGSYDPQPCENSICST